MIMIYTNIEVEIPHKKQLNKRGNEYYVYEILSRKKHTTKEPDGSKDHVAVVGKVIHDKPGMMNPNDKYFELHPENRPIGESELSEFDDVIHVGADFAIDKIITKLGIDTMLKNVFPKKYALIISLMHYYLISTNPAGQLYKYFSYDHYTGMDNIASESTISRLFNHDIDVADIMRFMNFWTAKEVESLRPGSEVIIDFDSTSFNSAASRAALTEYGHPKVNENLPQYNVLYFVNQKTGIPFYYDLYYGSIVDMAHCRKAFEKLNAYQKDFDALFVGDRGYFTKPNLKFLLSNVEKFLIMGKDNSKSDELISKLGEELKNNAKYWIADYDTCGMRIEGEMAFTGMDNLPEQYIYLFYNEEKALCEKNAFNTRLKSALKECQNAIDNDACDKDGYYLSTYGKQVLLELDKDQRLIAVRPNHYNQTEQWKKFGFFWIVSNQKMAPEKALKIYRHRDEIEKCFRGVKSSFGFDKIYAQTDSCIESKTFIAFLCSMVRSNFLSQVKEYISENRGETVQTILCELDKIKIERHGDTFIYKYCITKTQRKILGYLGINDSKLKTYLMSLNESKKLC